MPRAIITSSSRLARLEVENRGDGGVSCFLAKIGSLSVVEPAYGRNCRPMAFTRTRATRL